jgi:hypothetical protein
MDVLAASVCRSDMLLIHGQWTELILEKYGTNVIRTAATLIEKRAYSNSKTIAAVDSALLNRIQETSGSA